MMSVNHAHLRLLLAVCLLVLTAPRASALKKGESIDIEAAGPDWQVQGEYTGGLDGQGDDGALGAQVIALSNGRFQAVFLPGGLPGDGWEGGDRFPVDGKREGDTVAFAPSKAARKYMAGPPHEFSACQTNPPEGQAAYKATVEDAVMTGTTPQGDAFRLDRVIRGSPTLGREPPDGAAVILPYTENTKPALDGLQVAGWQPQEDGCVLVTRPPKTKSRGARSGHRFGDKSFHLHVEFSSSFNPRARSQGRGNSGVFPPPGREVQVLDSFGLEGKPNECGGIYKSHSPRINMCFPPLTWQTYDIHYTAPADAPDGQAFYKVVHNGVVIHECLNVKPAGGLPKPLSLQDHNDAVRYRNIWVLE